MNNSSRVTTGDPFSRRVGQQWLRLGVESVDLVGASGRYLRQQPVHGLNSSLPLRGGALSSIIRVAEAQNTYNILVQHAGGDIQQNENAPPVHSQTRDVTAVTASLPEGRHVLTGGRELIAPGLEPFGTLLQGLDVSSQLLDVLLSRQ